MALPDDYLKYPNRRHGMDHDLYRWSMLKDRAPVRWPNDAKVALWISVSLQFFPLNPTGKPIKLPGGMMTPYPDLRHFTLRDYGNRVGIWRLFRLFDKLGLKASFAINSAVAERVPLLVREIASRGDEIIGHGIDMDHAHATGVDPETERGWIEQSLAVLRQASGQKVHGWLSPGKSESAATPGLLAANGVEWFCDWVNDEMPYRFETGNGPLTAMPHSGELDDRQILVEYRHTENAYTQQLLDQHAYLSREAETAGGRILSLTLHPWVIGQPHRIGALEQALTAIVGSPGVWSASGEEILATWQRQQST